MPGSFIVKSRHQTTFHFRRRVPLDLVACIGKTHLVASLRTDSRLQAIIRARAAAAQTDALFAHLRTMPDKDFPEGLRIDFGFKLDLNELGKVTSITVTDAKPEEQDAVNSAIATALQNLPGNTPSPAQTSTPKTSGKTITETWNDYKAEKIAAKAWKDGEDAAKNDYWPHVRTLIEVIGDKPIAAVTADDANLFQTHVLNDPAGGSPGNRDKRLTRAGALFRWAKTKRTITDDFSELFRYPGRIETNSYIAFDLAELKALFESDDYKENSFKTPWAYWIPLLGLFTGARLNELCQLTASDIGQHDGIPTIAILDDKTKRLKTTASRRIIPIHSTLIACGFLDFTAKINTGRIFPDLPESKARPGDFSKEPGRHFTDYRRKVNVGSPKERSRKSFHSFRSTLISTLRKADVPGDRRRRLAGHEASDVHDKNYDGGDALTMFNFTTLKEDIERAQFDIIFTPYR